MSQLDPSTMSRRQQLVETYRMTKQTDPSIGLWVGGSFVVGAVIGALLFWLLPGFETETMLFGWAHGLGFIALCVMIWIAAVKREAPYTLLAATLTPVGPVGSVIGIELIERKGWGIADSPA